MKKIILEVIALLILIIFVVCGSYYIISKRHQNDYEIPSDTKYINYD